MSPSSELRVHRPAIEPEQVDELRRRLFGGRRSWPAIPGYEIEAQLGQGAFGRVYLAFDPRFQRQVALKVVAVDSPEARVRIEREAQALARLSHPHVVQVYDKGPAGEHGYFLALEYVDGPDLHKWLADEPRALREILAKFLQVAEGLAAAHRAGLVHRDLKPANVIVGSDGRARVLDFGLARATDDSSTTHGDEPIRRRSTVSQGVCAGQPCDEASRSAGDQPTVAHVVPGQPDAAPGGDEGCGGSEQLARPLTARGRFVGTPSYAAPEQHFGEADARSDQFSFCVALFEAVYRRRPLPLRRDVDPGQQLRTESIDFRPGERRVPRWLVALLRQGLALDPRRRHASMDAIARALRLRLHARPARIHAAWLTACTLGLAAIVAVLVGLRGEAEACRQGRDEWPREWLAHRDAVARELPALGAELDAYAERWHAGRLAACHEPEPLRRAAIDDCLDAGAAGLDRLVRELGTADRSTWQHLHAHPGPRPLAGLVETLPDPARCTGGLEPRAEPEARAGWGHLLTARIALAHGELAQAAGEGELALAKAHARGDRSRMVVAEYQQRLANARRGEPPTPAAVLSLVVRALEAGERTLAADVAATLLALQAAGPPGAAASPTSAPSTEQLRRLADELDALRSAGASDPGETPAIAAWLELAAGHARLALGEPEQARALYHAARERFAAAGAPPQLVALAELDEAIAMSAASPPAAEAVALAERALAIRRSALGPGDPRLAHELRALGEILVRTGDLDGALARYAEADALLATLALPLERVFLRAERVHAHWLAARRARAEARQAELEGREPAEPRARFERQRHLALRETLELERMADPLLARAPSPDGPAPLREPARLREQARVWAVAMASYGYHRGCWDEMLAAGRRLEQICEQLEGGEPSCVAGQRQRQGLLEQGAAALATADGCTPAPEPR